MAVVKPNHPSKCYPCASLTAAAAPAATPPAAVAPGYMQSCDIWWLRRSLYDCTGSNNL